MIKNVIDTFVLTQKRGTMESLKKLKKEIAILTIFILIIGTIILFFLHQKNVEGSIFSEKVQKETENNMISDDSQDKGREHLDMNNEDEIDISVDTKNGNNTEAYIEETCLEDMKEFSDTPNNMVINDNSSDGEEEVIEGSWLSKYTVTPEILKEYSILWESGSIKKKLNVTELLQSPELPSGCEVTSLTASLNYLDYDVDKITMTNNYLDMGAIGETNPYKAFIGTPDDNGAYGCFAPVIINCANKFLNDINAEHMAYDYSNNDLQSLFKQIDLGYPVIIWATIDMLDTYTSAVWNIDGEEIRFPANEHCLLLTGYDYEHSVVHIMDPMKGNVTYDMALFNYRFNQIGNQAVVIK